MEIAYVGNMFVVDTTCQNIVNINKLILVFKTIFCLFKEYCLYIFWHIYERLYTWYRCIQFPKNLLHQESKIEHNEKVV